MKIKGKTINFRIPRYHTYTERQHVIFKLGDTYYKVDTLDEYRYPSRQYTKNQIEIAIGKCLAEIENLKLKMAVLEQCEADTELHSRISKLALIQKLKKV